jgi:uncharacterized protein
MTMTTLEILRRLTVGTDALVGFCRRWKVARLWLFGSVLSERFTPDSDLDVLVSFAPEAPWTLFDLVRMRDELATMAGRPVDLAEREVVERSANYLRREKILASARLLYAEG